MVIYSFVTNYSYSLISSLILLASVIVNDWFTGSLFAQKFLLSLGVAFAVYWTLSIFIFLFKRSLYTSYTVVIQRYWKRALYIFWGLELFLFGTYVYLVLVAPTEVEWLLDQPQLFQSQWVSGVDFFSKALLVILPIILIIVMQYATINLSVTLRDVCAIMITVALGVVVWGDFVQTYAYSVYFTGFGWAFDMDSGLWGASLEVDKTRVLVQYVFVLTLLKFWHTVFIAAFWLLTVMFYTQSPYMGQGALAANRQNFFFLYGFVFLWGSFLYKAYANYLFEYVYAWFFVNPWGLTLVGLKGSFEVLWSLFCISV